MRLANVLGVGLASWLVAGVSFAAPSPNTTRTQRNTPPPSTSDEGNGGELTSRETSEEQHGGADLKDEVTKEGRGGQETAKKPWLVVGEWETHRLVRQNDLQGQAPDKAANFLTLYAQYDVTDYDRIGVRGGFSQRFITDDGETGIRSDDIAAYYTRFVPLPERFLLRATAQLTAPTSFDSQKQGLITSPRLSLTLDRRFGDFLVTLRGYDDAYIVKYTTAQGGQPNPRNRFVAYLEGEYILPFLPELSVGADVTTEWFWYYNVGSPPAGQSSGAVQDATFPTQPVQQLYGGEVYVRYFLPTLAGVNSDVTVAFAQGDPSLGFTEYIHDGIPHGYGFFRQTSEVYAVLSARYLTRGARAALIANNEVSCPPPKEGGHFHVAAADGALPREQYQP